MTDELRVTFRKNFRIAVIMTGGTIAKTYDPQAARMCNSDVTIDAFICTQRLPGTRISYIDLMRKDSLEINSIDRNLIVERVLAESHDNDAVIIIHGTDTLAHTGEVLYKCLPTPAIPVVLTGAMIPLVVKHTDGIQNITEAIMACKLLPAGIYTVFHGTVLPFPGVIKDREQMTFVQAE